MDSMHMTPKNKADRGQNIKVFVRVRPLNEIERRDRAFSVVHTPSPREVNVRDKSFSFDKVFGVESTQPDVYKSVVSPLVTQVLQGYNCTVFAYGQTGTGKTHTMEGPPDDDFPNGKVPDSELGIIPRALNDIFDNLRMGDTAESFVRVSFIELYNEEIFDLLSGHNDQTRLRLYDDPNKKGSVIIKDLNDVRVMDKREVYKILRKGAEKRRTAETKMNAHSSRSHTIFTVTVYMYERSVDGDEVCKIGKLNLVDLAGSENIARSGAADKQAREAGNINQSLLTLGRVITSLVAGGAQHVPYRESRLTRLLQDSLGGRTKTSIIATVSPASTNVDLTFSTLDYAQRAKKITNKPEVNLKISNKEKIMEYQSKIDRLQAELQAVRDKEGAVFLPREMHEEQVKRLEAQEEELKTLTKDLKTLETLRDELNEAMSDLKIQLASETAKLGETERLLDCVKTVLHKTEFEKREKEYLVERHTETERKLRAQAEVLLKVSDEATLHREQLHDKLDRQRFVDSTNEESTKSYHKDFSTQQSQILGTVSNFVEKRNQFTEDLTSNIEQNLERRSNEKEALKNNYSETITKLIQTVGEIDRVASGNETTEHTWMNDVLSRLKSETDLQSESFNRFLMENLLTMHTSVLESIVNLRKTVKELSDKMDHTVAQRTNTVESHLTESEEREKVDTKVHAEHLSKLNSQTQEIIKSSKMTETATNEFDQKSDQVINLVQELLTELVNAKQHYIVGTKDAHTSIVDQASKTNSELESLQTHSAKLAALSAQSRGKLRTELESESDRFSGEKSLTIETILNTADMVKVNVDKFKETGEKFVSVGKKAWIQKYQETEKDFQTKKESLAQFTADLVVKTQEIKEDSGSSLTKMDQMLENALKSDLANVNKDKEKLKSETKQVSQFGENLTARITQARRGFDHFITEGLSKDLPTGQTPSRVRTEFPRKLVDGTPDQERIKTFRQRTSVSDIPPPKFDLLSVDEDDDGDSVISSSTYATEGRHSNPGSQRTSDVSAKLGGSVSGSMINISESEGFQSDKENVSNDPTTFSKPMSKLRPPSTRERNDNRARLGSRNNLESH